MCGRGGVLSNLANAFYLCTDAVAFDHYYTWTLYYHFGVRNKVSTLPEYGAVTYLVTMMRGRRFCADGGAPSSLIAATRVTS